MLPTTFPFIWQSGFRGEDFQKSTNQKQELSVTAMCFNESGKNQQSLQRIFHRCFLPRFGSFGTALSDENTFLEINQSETRIVCGGHVCLTDRDEMSKLYRGHSIDASYQVSVHLAEGFQRRRLKCEKLTDDRRRTPSDNNRVPR